MKVLDAIPQEIMVITQFSVSELMYLKLILDNMTFDYNGTDETHQKAKEYLEHGLYPALEQLIHNVTTNGLGSNP